MLGRLLWLGLDVKLALEADLLFVIDRHLEERAEVIQLTTNVGVPKRRVTLAATPEGVAFTAELVRDLDGLFHLRRSVGECVGVAACGGAVHVTRVGEQAGRAPKELDAGAFLLGLEHLGHGVEILVRGGEALALGRDVAIMKGIVRCAELLHELERDLNSLLGVLDRLGTVVPRAQRGAHAERVGEGVPESVPVDDGEPEVILHGLALDDFVLVVPLKGQRIFAVRTFVTDFLYLRKIGHFLNLLKIWVACAAGLLKGKTANDNPKPAFWRCHWPSAWL